MNLIISKTILDHKFLLSERYQNLDKISYDEFYGEIGHEHYKLLSYLSTQFNDCDIFDIGTHRGTSALALSVNKNNRVYSFDIENRVSSLDNSPRSIKNIEFVICNLFEENERLGWQDKLLNSPLIFLDIDPHDGFLEYEFYKYLVSVNYKGIIVFDDIHYFPKMRENFWSKVREEHKMDLTKFGHWSGTGLVNISGDIKISIEDEIVFPPVKEDLKKDWTLVTAYFDLTKCSDASQPIKDRDGKYYLSHSKGCLSRDNNMVIYCDPEFEEDIRQIRGPILMEKTKIIPVNFEDMPLTKHRNKIIENRITHPYYFDPRNTPSYYLLCMARYSILKQVILENPFNTTHFAWINICIERMGPNNLYYLDDGLNLFRDKFSTCYIDYIDPYFTKHLQEYYRWGRCSMCSGFFTGNHYYMYKFCSLIEDKFLEFLKKGYGHADEQLFLAVYFENPDIFDFYYGDYQQMITNYSKIHENIDFIFNMLIKKAFYNKDWKVCYNACKFVWNSYLEKTDLLSNPAEFLMFYNEVKKHV